MKKLFSLLFLLSIYAKAQNCDSLIVIHVTFHDDGSPTLFAGDEIDSVKNGLIISKNFAGVETRLTYDSQNRLVTVSSPSDSSHYTYDSFSRLINSEWYVKSSGNWRYRTDSAELVNSYSTHGIDSSELFSWDGSTLNSTVRKYWTYNSSDTLATIYTQRPDSGNWTTDTISLVYYGSFGNGVFRKDSSYLQTVSPNNLVKETGYDSLERILYYDSWWYGWPDEYERYSYECNDISLWVQSWSGAHSGNSMSASYDSLCRKSDVKNGHYSMTDSYYNEYQYFYADCNSMVVLASEDSTLCKGDSATIQAAHYGGTPPYSVHWSPSAGLQCDTCLVTKASPAVNTSYIISVTDSGGQTQTDTVLINAILRPHANIYIASIDTLSLCQSAILAADSVSSYGFYWTLDGHYMPGYYSAHLPINQNGQYIVTVSTTINCPVASDTLDFTYFTSIPPTFTISRDCNLLIANASANYSYTWYFNNNLLAGQTNDTLFAQTPGDYKAIATNSDGCQSNPVTFTFYNTNVTTSIYRPCPGNCNGSISIYPSNLTYSWSTGDSVAYVTNLCPGVYTIMVTDYWNCIHYFQDTLIEKPDLPFHLVTTGTSDSSTCDGIAIGVDSLNQSTTAQFYWDNSTYGPMTDSLCFGWHTVNIVPYSTYCQETDSFYIAASLSQTTCQAIEQHTNVTCNGYNDGSITISCSTGSPFGCSWNSSTGNTYFGSFLGQIPAGTYSCMMIDSAGCRDSVTVTITEPQPLQATINHFESICGDSCVATALISGGTPPYQYHWCDGSGGSTLHNCIGNCYLVVTDSKNCTLNQNFPQTFNPPISFQIESNSPTCAGCNDGSLTIHGIGGTSPYTYSIDGINYSNDSIFSSLATGSYNVCIEGNDGCTNCQSTNLTLGINSLPDNLNYLLSPNPVHQHAILQLRKIDQSKHNEFVLLDLTGKILRIQQISWPAMDIYKNEISSGAYLFLIRNEDGILFRGKILFE